MRNFHAGAFCLGLLLWTTAARAQDAVTPPVSKQTASVKVGEASAEKPRLFVLTVGAGVFADSAVKPIPVAVRDAGDVAGALSAQTKTGLYQAVETKTVTGKAATRQGVRDGLQWLRGHVGSHDVAVIFVSGHKMVDNELNTYVLTSDVKTDSTAQMRATSLPLADVQDAAEDLPGNTLLLLDLSHGSPINDLPEEAFAEVPKKTKKTRSVARLGITRLAQATGQVRILHSVTGRETSQTVSPVASTPGTPANNSAFAAAVVEAVTTPRAPSDAPLTVDGLFQFVSRRVEESTNGRQRPRVEEIDAAPTDFPLAVPTAYQPAPKSAPKPVVKPSPKPTPKPTATAKAKTTKATRSSKPKTAIKPAPKPTPRPGV